MIDRAQVNRRRRDFGQRVYTGRRTAREMFDDLEARLCTIG